MKRFNKKKLEILGAVFGVSVGLAAPLLTAWLSSKQSPLQVGAISTNQLASTGGQWSLNGRYSSMVIPSTEFGALAQYGRNTIDLEINEPYGDTLNVDRMTIFITYGGYVNNQHRIYLDWAEGVSFNDFVNYVWVNGTYPSSSTMYPGHNATLIGTNSSPAIGFICAFPFTVTEINGRAYYWWSQDLVGQGYADGYTDGYKAGGEGKYDEGFTAGRSDGYGLGYDDGYEDGVVEGETHGSMTSPTGTIGGLMLTIVSVPLTILTKLEPLGVFGVPLIAILMSFLFVALIVWLIKKLI